MLAVPQLLASPSPRPNHIRRDDPVSYAGSHERPPRANGSAHELKNSKYKHKYVKGINAFLLI